MTNPPAMTVFTHSQWEENKWYGLTITYKAYFDPSAQIKKTSLIPKVLGFAQKIYYCIEYHKKKDYYGRFITDEYDNHIDNPLRQHVHVLFSTSKKMSLSNLELLEINLRKNGIIKLEYLGALENLQGWYDYIRKDVDINNERYKPYQHWYEIENDLKEEEEENVEDPYAREFKLIKRIKK